MFSFFFKQKTAYEMRISDWSSDVCSSDLPRKRRSMSPQAQINAAMCALMREVRLLLSPAQSTAREHIAESRQERAKAALRQWRKAGRMPPFSGRRQPRKADRKSKRLNSSH